MNVNVCMCVSGSVILHLVHISVIEFFVLSFRMMESYSNDSILSVLFYSMLWFFYTRIVDDFTRYFITNFHLIFFFLHVENKNFRKMTTIEAGWIKKMFQRKTNKNDSIG